MHSNPEEVSFLQSERLIESKQIYNGAIIDLYVNQLTDDRNNSIQRELIHHQPAVGILTITNEEKVVLIKQYRAAVDQYMYEVPAGIIDHVENELEDTLTAAKRELEEETAFRANNWSKVAKFYVSPGFLDELIYLFMATDLEEVAEPLPQDEDEDIVVEQFTKNDIQQMIEQDKIMDAKTLYALQYWLNLAE